MFVKGYLPTEEEQVAYVRNFYKSLKTDKTSPELQDPKNLLPLCYRMTKKMGWVNWNLYKYIENGKEYLNLTPFNFNHQSDSTGLPLMGSDEVFLTNWVMASNLEYGTLEDLIAKVDKLIDKHLDLINKEYKICLMLKPYMD